MAWFQRITKGILTKTVEKKEAPDGVWTKCKGCKKTIQTSEYVKNLSVCPQCDTHGRIGSKEYFELFFDEGVFEELHPNLSSRDVLGFTDLKPYPKRLKDAKAKTNLVDALRIGYGKINEMPTTIACMDFSFIGGSMGSVVGEKIAKAIAHSLKTKAPLIIIAKSGGARMMEAAFSLMQMAKTSAKLSQLAKAGIPYISLMTDPTTGGVTASFAMLGDVNIGEPGALIGFAGPRVIKETIKKDLPEGFQRSEFLQEKGFLDLIVHRKDLKEQISTLLRLLAN